ncbi:hypothetical protein BJ508DRAFT_420014 [Ascobolus immersus RN42]|uniref:Uncharacterized protein n=1 Tax=Ascobolus immersus RN42 TaxID=1160509 RepID=A0A3N4HGC6_ASCIM|nr:hypothetical protein BJ508DRAFT_420014 [Ascobolus immersus RN42]
MSLSNTFVGAGPAVVHIFVRQDTPKLRVLQCESEGGNKGDFSISDCPSMIDIVSRCARGGLNQTEFEGGDEAISKERLESAREECADMCDLFATDDVLDLALECAKDRCKNAEKEFTKNPDFEEIFKGTEAKFYMPMCQKLGLTTPKHWKSSPLICEWSRHTGGVTGDFSLTECKDFQPTMNECFKAPIAALNLTKPVAEVSKADLQKAREFCSDLCELFTTDKAVDIGVECSKDLCKNSEKDFVKNSNITALFKDTEYKTYLPFCERIGLAGTNGSDEGKDDGKADDKDDDKSPVKDEDSGAGFVKGWKGASFVAAVAFGSIFMA